MEDGEHRLMHEVGRWTRRNLGCSFQFDGTRYSQRCPIDIAHKKFGNSVGYIAQRRCSICENELSECEHIVGRSYWVRGGSGIEGRCRVCLRGTCRHSPNRLYRASVRRMIENAELREVSRVRRPAQPEARLTQIGIDTQALVDKFGAQGFTVGMRVSCDKCLGACWGFDTLPARDDSVPD
jgi:hypothetical protein